MSNKLGGLQGTAYLGTNADKPPNWHFNTRDPDRYDNNNVSIGDFWLNKNTAIAFLLVSLNPLLYGITTSKGTLATWVQLQTVEERKYVSAYLTDNIPNITGDGTNFVLACSGLVSPPTLTGYNTATGLFTAPTDGIYSFSVGWTFDNINMAHTSMSTAFGLVHSGPGIPGPDVGQIGYNTFICNPANMSAAGFLRNQMNIDFVMNAGDSMNVQIRVNNGTKTVGLSLGIGVAPGTIPSGTWFKIVKIG